MTRVPHDGQILTALWSVHEQGLHTRRWPRPVPASHLRFARRARFDVGLSLIELKRFDGAFKELSGLYAQGRAAAISNAIGIVQLRRGGVTDATQLPAVFFERATREDPSNVDYLFNLGYARALASDAAGALAALREAVRRIADGDAHLVMSAVLVTTARSTEGAASSSSPGCWGRRRDDTGRRVVQNPAGVERVEPSLDAALRPDTALGQPGQRVSSRPPRSTDQR